MNRKDIEKEFQNKNNIDQVLPGILNVISSDYYAYSMMTYAMNYYNYFELMIQSRCEESDQLFERVVQITSKAVLMPFDGQNREKALKLVDAIRAAVMELMKCLTAYADKFAIHEYILNRIEKNFQENQSEMEDDVIAQKILAKIFSDKDQMLINSRIRMMLSQLPIRMTKQKFLDMLKDSFGIYEGSDEYSVDDYVYMLTSAAGLESVSVPFESNVLALLEEKHLLLDKMEPAFINEEEYSRYRNLLSEAVEIIQENTDRMFSLQEVINSLYCLLLNQPYASESVLEETMNLMPILSAVSENVQLNKTESISDNIVSLFEHTEGKLEHYVENLSKDEALLHECEETYRSQLEAMMLRAQFECLSLSQKLCSNSAFIELHNQRVARKADKAYIEAAFDSMAQQVNDILISKNKWKHRAVIAAILREMPVLFGSVEEVKDYIRNSLSGCKDLAEKSASIELFMSGVSE